jgi:hypothetical protein
MQQNSCTSTWNLLNERCKLVRFGFLVAVTVMIQVFWDVTLCQWAHNSDISVIIQPSFSGSSSPRMATQEKSEHYTGIVAVGSKWSVWQTCRAVVGRTWILCRPSQGLHSIEGSGRPAQSNGATEEIEMSQGYCKKFCAGCRTEPMNRMYKTAPSSSLSLNADCRMDTSCCTVTYDGLYSALLSSMFKKTVLWI